MDEIVRFQTQDGPWEVGGADRRRGIWPEDLQCTWDDWGSRSASFVLHRKASVPQPDIAGLTPVIIEKGGGVWEGFVDQTPQVDEYALQVECIGWPDHANDEVEQKFYVHSDLTAWQDTRSFLDTQLATWHQMGRVESETGAVVIGYEKGVTVAADSDVGVTLDLGPGNTAKRIVIEYDTVGAFAGFVIFARTTSTPGGATGAGLPVGAWSDAISNVAMTTASPQVGTFTTPNRYVTVFLHNGVQQGPVATDTLLRLKALRVFTDTAYESSNGSILKASTVLKDALPRLCSQWSSDVTGVDATLLNLPMVAPSAPRNFRELTEALNAPHGYVRKLERERKFRFKPVPSKPVLAVGEWPGVQYRDSSKNATRDIYNKAIGDGRDLSGRPIRVERFTAQLSGIAGEVVSSPAFVNPSFDVNASGWVVSIGIAGGSITRQTAPAGGFDTAPAAGVWDKAFEIPSTLIADLGVGTWKRGVVYRIGLRVRDDNALGGAWFFLRVGAYAAGDEVRSELFQLSQGFQTVNVVWCPRRDYSVALGDAPQLSIVTQPSVIGMTTDMTVDSGSVEIARPTLLDKRGRTRAQVVSMPSQVIDESVVGAFCDVWLRTHMRTRARGDLSVQGAVRDYTNGAPVHPFAIGERTGELICLLNESDPDTGGIGRNVPIASVTYSGNDETAQVAIDDQRDNFEQLVSRYNIIAGGSA